MKRMIAGESIIEWLGHSTFRITTPSLTIYIDPFKVSPHVDPGNMVLVTHEHFDHCSHRDLRRVSGPGTVVIAPYIAMGCVRSAGLEPILISPWETREIMGARITAVPAYNINKYRAPGEVYHDKRDGRVGYVISVPGAKIYHAGDTDLTPDIERMADMLNIDVALLPVSGVYVMTPQEAARAVAVLKPRIAVPMHYGEIVGSRQDAEKFKQLASRYTRVVLLEKVS